MSRFTKTIGPIEYAWGFDPPLNEYFFEKYDQRVKKNDGCIFHIASRYSLMPHPNTPAKSTYNKSEILEIIETEEKLLEIEIIPERHKIAIAGDLRF